MWEISGEDGKRFGSAKRASQDVAGDMVLQFESLQPDVVRWSAFSGSISDAHASLPELGEEIQIWRDGVRVFVGVVTALPLSLIHI